jgi:hypothetical protein
MTPLSNLIYAFIFAAPASKHNFSVSTHYNSASTHYNSASTHYNSGMAPTRGQSRNNPIVLGDEPDEPIIPRKESAVLDLTQPDNDLVQKVDGDDDFLESRDSAAAWHRAQNKKHSTRASTDHRTRSPRARRSRRPFTLVEPSTSVIDIEDSQEDEATTTTTTTRTAIDKQDQDGKHTSPPNTPSPQSECTSARQNDPVRASSPANVEGTPACETSRTMSPTVNIETSIPPDDPALASTPINPQAENAPMSEPEHLDRASGIEEERNQTLSELTTTNQGLAMSDRDSGLDPGVPSTTGGSMQASASSRKKQKAIKSVKPVARPRFHTRPLKQAERIFGTDDEGQRIPTTRPIDAQSPGRKLEPEPTTERDLSTRDSQQKAVIVPRISDTAPATTSSSTQLLPNIESAKSSSRSPSHDRTNNVDQSTSSTPLRMANTRYADFEGIRVAGKLGIETFDTIGK